MKPRRIAELLLVAGACITLGGAQHAPHVGIQAGHWQISDIPSEQWRLRADTGAAWGGVREVDVNLEIAELVVDQLRLNGVQADLLPATIPQGYAADALVSIHAEGVAPQQRSGWKISEPWISSEASRLLRDDLESLYGPITSLDEDRYGITQNMRGYYAFDWTRFFHAIASTTPSVLIETGFLGSDKDRRVIVDHPEIPAVAIVLGIMQFLKDETRLTPEQFVPEEFFRTKVVAPGAAVRFYPSDSERLVGRLAAGTEVYVFSRQDGWSEIVSHEDHNVFGWVHEKDVAPRP